MMTVAKIIGTVLMVRCLVIALSNLSLAWLLGALEMGQEYGEQAIHA